MDYIYRSVLSGWEVPREEFASELESLVVDHIEGFDPLKPFMGRSAKAAIKETCLSLIAGSDSARKAKAPTTKELSALTGINENTLNAYFKTDATDLPLGAFAHIVDACWAWIYRRGELDSGADVGQLVDGSRDPMRYVVAMSLLGISVEEKALKGETDRLARTRAAAVARISLLASMADDSHLKWLLQAAEYIPYSLPREWGGAGVEALYSYIEATMGSEILKHYQERKAESSAEGTARKVVDPEVITRRNFEKLERIATDGSDAELLRKLQEALPKR